MPVFFWQQRLGGNSRRFLPYKFRTLRTPFGEDGRKLSDDERLSPIYWLVLTLNPSAVVMMQSTLELRQQGQRRVAQVAGNFVETSSGHD
jgi:lipopolysaccharide/colanic/teichoic acid biosynthesis glycosyltransferase